MKDAFIFTFFSIFISLSSIGQAPQKMTYQAVIRDANNKLISLTNVNLRLSILQNNSNGKLVYSEMHYTVSNINGLINLQIGTGSNLFGKFAEIDWSKGPYFVKTETDSDGGFNFRITGTSELLSVPYALYALNANFDTTSLHNRIVNLQAQAIANKKNIDINLDSIKENEKDININLDSIKVNTVKINNNIVSINTKIDTLDLIAILAGYQKIGKIINAITVEGKDSVDVKSNGNLQSSKNISLTGNIESLGSTSSIGSLDKPFKDLYISSHSLSIASDVAGQNTPPTVLSNVNGNLQISSGGFKLMGTNAAFIAPRFEGKLIGNASTATKFETPRTINGILFDGSTNIVLPDLDHDDKYIKISQLNGTDSFNINIKGNLGSSGNVTVAGNIEALGSTSTLGTIDKPFKGLFLSSGSLSIASDTLGQNIPAAIISNVRGNLEISAGGLKLAGTDEAFIAPRIISTLTGNASTATKFENARNINGVSFDGSADIIIPATIIKSLSFNNIGTGDASGGTFDGSVTKTISYNSIGASPLAGSSLITTVGTLTAGAIPYTLLSGTIPTWNQATTGNAATATKLAATKNINGVAFDGSSDITITAVADAATLAGTTLNATVTGSSLTSVGTLTNLTVTNPIAGSVTGNAATVTTNANLTGPITSVGNATSIANGTITNSMLANAAVANLSGTNTGDQINITGNAATATKLAATKNINGVAFDGSSDITITAVANAGTLSGTTLNASVTGSSLTSVGTLTNLTVTNPIAGSVTGNAATVTTNANLTGVVTSVGNATSIANGTITNSMLANAAVANLSGTNTGDQINITGNAATATKLAATKNINGVAFDGSSDITITAVADAGTLSGTTLNATVTGSSLTSVGTITTGTWNATTIGIAKGGTNTNAVPTAGAIVYGNGTSYAISGVGTSGQYLQSAGAGAPIWAQPGPASMQVLTTSGTYTTPAGVKAIMIELVGGGWWKWSYCSSK